MKRRYRTILCLLIAAVIWNMMLFTVSAQNMTSTTAVNAKGILIESKVGYNGNYALNQKTPVQFQLTNELGRDVKGELVLNIRNEFGIATAHILPIEITEGSTVEAYMTVDGNFTKTGTWLQFYEGSVDNGELIEIIGSRNIIGQSVNTNNIVGIAANDPDTLNFVAFFNNNGFSTTPIVLGDDFHANSMQDLSMFSVLALNDIATSEWPEAKVKAVKDWVANGGTLLVGGGAGYRQTAAAFSELVPVEASSTVEWNEASVLSQYIGSNDVISSLQISDGQLVRGDVLLEHGETPIVAVSEYGFGKVYYTAFDLALKPFSVWDGRTAFIQSILSETLMLAGSVYYNDQNWSLEQAVSYFPRLKSPNVFMLLLIFFGYTLIVAPILYLVLKRMDRREWSWWMIPSLAVVSTVLIVIVGASNKTVPYVHSIEIAEVKDDVVLEYGATSVFIPNNRDVSLNIDDGSGTFVINGHYTNDDLVDTSKRQRIYHHPTEPAVTFTGNKYWTTKAIRQRSSIYNIEQHGSLEVSLEQRDSEFLVHVKNNTSEPMKYVTLVANSQTYYITDLAAGEEYSDSLPASFNSMLAGYANGQSMYRGMGHTMMTTIGLNWDEFRRESSILDNDSVFDSAFSVVAFTYNEADQYVVNGKKVKSDSLKLWVVDILDQISRLVDEEEVLHSTLTSVERGEYSLSDQYNFHLASGAVEYKFQIPSANAGQRLFGSLDPDANQFYGIETELYNIETMQWEKAPTGEFSLDPYINSFNMLGLRIDSGEQYFEGSIPRLILKREVQ